MLRDSLTLHTWDHGLTTSPATIPINPCVASNTCDLGYSTTSTGAPAGFNWQNYPTLKPAVDLAIGLNKAWWITDNAGSVETQLVPGLPSAGGGPFVATSFGSLYPGKAVRISVDLRTNIPWIVTDSGAIYSVTNGNWARKG